MRGVWLSLLAVLIGGAMVAGGVWGVIASTGDDGSSTGGRPQALGTSSPADCATVAERDPRFRLPHDLLFGPYGRATVNCAGAAVTFTIDIDAGVLKPTTFYNVILERGRRREKIGSFLTAPGSPPGSFTADSEVRLRRYDFLTVEEDPFFARGQPRGESFRAAL